MANLLHKMADLLHKRTNFLHSMTVYLKKMPNLINTMEWPIYFRWTLQITDFGLHDLRSTADEEWSDEENSYSVCKLLWKAPELLRDDRGILKGTQKGDVYSFGIILYEIFGRAGPYGDSLMTTEEILNQLKFPEPGCGFMRPDIDALKDNELDYKAPDYTLGKDN